MRRFVICVLFSLVALAQPSSAAPPLPKSLEPYLADGVLQFGDFAWVRGRFERGGAERRAWDEAVAWANAVAAERKAVVAAEVAKHGVTLGGPHAARPHCYGEMNCWRILVADRMGGAFETWARLSRAAKEARPVFDGYQLAVEAARDWARVELAKARGGEVEIATMAEQMYRRDLYLLPIAPDEAALTPFHPNARLRLSDDGKRMLEFLLGEAMTDEDMRVTRWFKGLIATSGFPMPKDVGQVSWEAAWRIVRHADHDPAFQMAALDLFHDAVVASGGSMDFYASYVDQVLPDVIGFQRYGTQMKCRDGKPVLMPLEDESAVEARRAEVGLISLAAQWEMVPAGFCK